MACLLVGQARLLAAGKRVGVIGTGATGVQVVPVVAEQAAHVTVFQRTPNYVIAAGNRRLTEDERQPKW